MNVINSRSPFTITIDEVGQTETQIKVYVWNYPNTQPTIPTRVMQKSVLSENNTKTYYNISSIIQQHLSQSVPTISAYPSNESYSMWCYVVVEEYVNYGEGLELLDTFEAVGVDGYTRYTDGSNEMNVNFQQALTSDKWVIYYNNDKAIPYINYLVNHTGSDIRAKYEAPTGSPRYLDITTSTMPDGIYNKKVPIVDATTGFVWGKCKLTIYNVVTSEIYYVFNSENLCEPKYDPIVCTFVNKFGGWTFLTFFKNSQNTISAKGTDYSLMPSDVDYNIFKGQYKRMNLNGMQKVKCNTGWVDETYDELIEQLYLSETILLDNKPARIVNQSTPLKNYLNEKNINYTIEFEYAFNLVNNVV
jgi:hypothetical protein